MEPEHLRRLKNPEIFTIEDRSEWYQVNSFLLEMAQMAETLKLEPTSLIHLGGTANFYRMYQIAGSQTVTHFRGTHDMDLLSFYPGGIQRTLDALVAEHQMDPKGGLHRIKGYSKRKSHLPDKWSYYLTLGYNDNPGASSGFKIDVYEPSGGSITFNQRELKSDKIVLDPPEELVLKSLSGKTRGLVCVPSLRDYFIFKTDIVDFSKKGFRPKDKFDILTTVYVCQKLGIDFGYLVEGILEANKPSGGSAKSQEAIVKSLAATAERLRGLEKLFQNPSQDLELIPKDYPFFPKPDEIRAAKLAVQKSLNELKVKNTD